MIILRLLRITEGVERPGGCDAFTVATTGLCGGMEVASGKVTDWQHLTYGKFVGERHLAMSC